MKEINPKERVTFQKEGNSCAFKNKQKLLTQKENS